MATTVILPRQGQSVETCIITEWYKNKGDKIEKGDLLFSYETDKASFEEEAQVDGTLLEIFYGAGEEVAVLSEVAVIGAPGEAVATPGAPDKSQASEVPAAPTPPTGEPAQKEIQLEMPVNVGGDSPSRVPADASYPIAEGKTRISPRARKLAAEKGIDIAGIAGSGPGGRIIVRDIEAISAAPQTAATPEAIPAATPVSPAESTAARKVETTAPAARKVETTAPAARKVEPTAQAEAPAPKVETTAPVATPAPASSGETEDKPLSNIRKLIAKAMHASLQNSAQLTHHLSADVRSILSLRSKVKKMQAEGYACNITLNDMVCYSVIRALKKHTGANVHFLGESIRYFKKVHLGVAVDTDRGLMVPVIRNADDLSLAGLSEQIKSVAEACRAGKIDPDLLQPDAATFTVSNLGNYGVEMFTPVINLPQAGILGVNTIIQRPAQMEGGAFGFVPYMGLSLTYDHRAIDGGPATLFLAEIKKEIESFDHDLIKQ